MPFRVKDLMIDLTTINQPQLCRVGSPTVLCQTACSVANSITACHLACSYAVTNACQLACSLTVTNACQLACSYIATDVCRLSCSLSVTDICRLACTYIASPITICKVGVSPIACIAGSCGGISEAIAYGTRQETPQFGAQTYSSLKEQLKAALEQVEAEEKAVAESLTPQTVEEVEMLEGKLNEALGELKTRKAELQKKSGK